MKSKAPPRLGRLLGEYERLTRDEAVALKGRDFAALAAIHSFKPELLEEIIREGAAQGLDRRVLWFNERLLTLAALERDNVNFAARVLVQLSQQRENLEAARKRLRGLGHAYRGVGVSSSRLFAMS
jgi:hypothetical protein